jgi:hypothetical protein
MDLSDEPSIGLKMALCNADIHVSPPLAALRDGVHH